jgi:arylsulfatase A-like enzyme
MKRRNKLLVAASGLLCPAATAADNPNILVTRGDATGRTSAPTAWATKGNTTPNLDKLASEGLRHISCRTASI